MRRQSITDAKRRKAKSRAKAAAEYRSWMDRETSQLRRVPAPLFRPTPPLDVASLVRFFATPAELLRDEMERRTLNHD